VIRTPNGLAALFGRLTDPTDRETYASLISFVEALPENDELFRIVELLGLLSLVGQRVPVALAELLAELRGQAKAAAHYHGQVDARLAILPQEIAAGVDPGAIAKAMSEVFRQQLSDTGLQDSAALLQAATGSIKSLAFDATASLKPAAQEIRGIASAIANETAKLVTAARKVEEHNERLIMQQRSNRWGMLALAALVLFLLGGVAGIVVEKRQTTDLLSNVGEQIERMRTPATPTIVEMPRTNGRKSGL
jgi:hypothetical protein